jgi:hypothetical protein
MNLPVKCIREIEILSDKDIPPVTPQFKRHMVKKFYDMGLSADVIRKLIQFMK